jgi:hypothetical protein
MLNSQNLGQAALQVIDWADWHFLTAGQEDATAFETLYHAAWGWGFYATANMFVKIGERIDND